MSSHTGQTSAAAPPEPLPGSRGVAEAQEGVARARARLARSMSVLRQEVARRSDWREWVRRRPVPCLLGAFALGVWLGRQLD